MRKIAYPTRDHNTVLAAPAVLIALCLVTAFMAGCSDKVPNASSQNCQVVVDTSGWTAFQNIADHLSAGQAVPRAELEAYGELPTIAAWRASQAPHVPQVGNVANWLEGAWWRELGHQTRQKTNGDRAEFGHSYRYSHEHSDNINLLLQAYISGDQSCALRQLINTWISEANRPAPLVINFLPASAEIRLHEGAVFADTGVLSAGGTAQTTRQIASLLYRNLEAPTGRNPIESDGETAVAECLRVIMNEGVAGWIEQTTEMEFDNEHPSLRRVIIVPETFYNKARATVETFNRMLPKMLANPAVMASRGREFARWLAGNNAYTQTGYAMAAVIAHRLGEKKLIAVHNSVPLFLAAFQEAASQNPVPAPRPGTAGTELYETVPPLPQAVFEPLLALVKRNAPGA